MTTSREVRQLVEILDEEGFGSLAGEILTEINLGRQIDRYDKDDDSSEPTIVRMPIPDEQQLAEAIELIRLRLVEPVRAFVQAETIAGGIINAPAIRIRFVDPIEGIEMEPLSRTNIGDSQIVDKLGDLLGRLPQMIEPDTAAGT